MDLNIDKNTRYPTGFNKKQCIYGTHVDNISSVYSIEEPFGNCQTFSVGYINHLFNKYQTNVNDRTKTSDPFIYDYENIALSLLKFQFTSGKKLQVIIDIQDCEQYNQIINEIFKDHMVVKAPYISTNSNKMCLYLLKLEGAKNYILNIEKKRADEARQLEEERIAKLKASGQWKEPDFKLPEKWYIKTTEESNDIVINWYFKQKSITYLDKSIGNYFTSDLNGWMFTVNPHTSSYLNGYTEITFEQFEKYVLKKDSKELPKNWCVKPNTIDEDLEVMKFLEANGYNTSVITPSLDYYSHFPFINGGGSRYGNIRAGYEQITFEQFKKHFIDKKETVDNSNLPF